MPAAGSAEADPLQNGHPADLDPPAAPAAASAAAGVSASAGAWGLAQGGCRPSQPGHQPVNGTTQGLHSIVRQPEADHSHREGSPTVPGPPRNDADPFTGMGKFGAGSGQAQVKDEAVFQAAFQIGDTAMANEDKDVDIGAYVKTEETLLRQASGSSGSENGQAVLMDLDGPSRQPSPAANAHSASLGEQAQAYGQQCCCHQLHSL